ALLVKVLFNSFFIHQFGAKGSIFATGAGIGLAVILNLWRIKQAILFSYKQTAKRALFMVIFSGLMGLVIVLLKRLFSLFLAFEESRFDASLMLAVGIIVGAVVYLFLAYKSTLLEAVLGNMNILNRFRRKKHASR